MMRGGSFSRGAVSMRTTSSIGSAVPRWAVMSLSAGNDIGVVLLCKGRLFVGGFAEKGCERGDFVGRAFDADHRRTIDLERGPKCGRQFGDVVDIHRRQA